MSKHITTKFGNMRKEQEFIVYPYDGGDCVLIQSDKRIANVNLKTGRTVLSAQRQGGAYGVHLSPQLGAILTDFPSDKLIELQEHLWNNTGVQEIVKGVPVTYENKELFSSDNG